MSLKRSTTSGYVALGSKDVTIWHYKNGVRVNDYTKKTDATTGKITWTKSWSSAGAQTYYASFAGDTAYGKSTSSADSGKSMSDFEID